MKLKLLPILLALTLALSSGCGGPEANPPPAGSYTLPPTEIFHLNKQTVLCEVEVEQIFQDIYQYGFNQNDPYTSDCLVALCTVRQTFFRGPYAPSINPDTKAALWLPITGLEASEEAIRTLLDEMDTLVVHAYTSDLYQWISPDSLLGLMWQQEDGQDDLDTTIQEDMERLVLPPFLRAYELDYWSILPIQDGAFQAQTLADALLLSDQTPYYDASDPDLYFSDVNFPPDGCSSEDLYHFAEELSCYGRKDMAARP